MTFVSRHTSPRPITVLKNHGRRSGIDFGARAFLLSSRSNPPALSTACSTASLFSTDRWDASGPEGRVSASDFAFRALASHASMRLATMTKSTIVQSARIIMGLASEMVDTIESSRFMFFTFLPDCVLFRRIHMTGIGRRAMSLRMECRIRQQLIHRCVHFSFLRSPQPPAAVLQRVHGPAGHYRRARAGGGRGQRTVQSPSGALPGMGRRAGGTRPGCGVRASDGTGVMDRKASRSSGRRSARIHRSSMSTVPIRCRGAGWSSTRHAAGPSSD